MFADCQIIKLERPKPNTFLIRGLQYTTVVERMFCADTKEEREEWIKAIESIAEQLQVIDDTSSMDAEDLAQPSKRKVVSLTESYLTLKVLVTTVDALGHF